jgi:hypothetical protein
MKFVLAGLIISVILMSGCVSESEDIPHKTPVDLCIEKCREAKAAGQNLSDGPCLSNEIVEDWVCDVAHDPRQDVDDDPSNQCENYGVGASHFIEINEYCTFIRIK